MLIDLNNLALYERERNFNNGHLCDGFCIRCPNKNECSFSKFQNKRDSKYNDSDELDNRALNLDSFSSKLRKYGHKNEPGFSNPMKSYSGNSLGYGRNSGFSYSENSTTSGFHGSYSGKDDYSGMSPRSSKSNYCSGSGCSKG